MRHHWFWSLTMLAALHAGDVPTWESIPATVRIDSLAGISTPHAPAYAFAQGLGGWSVVKTDQSVPGTAQVSGSDAAAHLAVDYDFPVEKGWYGYLHVGCTLTPPGRGLGLSFRMQLADDFLPDAMRLRVIDAGGETWQYLVAAQRQSDGWWLCSTAFDRRDAGTGSWGGDGNHRLDYPLTVTSLIIERPKETFNRQGRLLIAEPQWIKPNTCPITVTTDAKRLGNLYAQDEALHFRASAPCQSLRWRLEGLNGQVHAKGEGTGAGTVIDTVVPSLGWFALVIDACDDGKVLRTVEISLAALPSDLAAVRNDAIGVNTHFNESWKCPLGYMDLLPRYGIRHIRDPLMWQDIEAKPGELTVPDHQAAFMRRAKDLGLSTLILLCYGNRAYEDGLWPSSDDSMAAFGRYAGFLAGRFADQISGVEIWNEYYGGCGMPRGMLAKGGKGRYQSPELYARMITAAHSSIKAVAPQCTVMGLGGEFHQFLDRCEKSMQLAPKAFDGITIHPYHDRRALEDADGRLSIRGVAGDFLAAAARQGVPGRLWATEFGFPAQMALADRLDEHGQAASLVRAAVLLLSQAGVERVYAYEWMDADTSGQPSVPQFGLVRHHAENCAPRPAGVALATMARMSAAKTASYRRNGQIHSVTFTSSDGTQAVAAWRMGPPAPARCTGSITAISGLTGDQRPTTDKPILDETPIWISGRNLQIEP